ncbi:hypothetical protein SDC9_86019 [bioreactor metagenome]|uniref:Uncharacterized protein n=1 Tax=bioreactor metagenome TaxID=1076179 RepID=A0A644ZEV2_9ZZZZ
MLRNRRRNAGDIRLLKAVLADQVHVDVPGDEYNRYAIQIGGCDSRDEVRRARPRSCDADANLAACARIAIRRMRRSLLVRR